MIWLRFRSKKVKRELFERMRFVDKHVVRNQFQVSSFLVDAPLYSVF